MIMVAGISKMVPMPLLLPDGFSHLAIHAMAPYMALWSGEIGKLNLNSEVISPLKVGLMLKMGKCMEEKRFKRRTWESGVVVVFITLELAPSLFSTMHIAQQTRKLHAV